jgi:hypothetical protein
MRLAYADPPYYGHGLRLYGALHPEAAKWDDKQAHIDLINQLAGFDGWALSCNPSDLGWLLPHCEEDVRVAAWCKTFHQIRPRVSVQYAWEPVVFKVGRKIQNRKPMVRDWLACARSMKRGVPGAKPVAFNEWVLDLLSWEPGDEMVDLFPGSNGLAEVVAKRS